MGVPPWTSAKVMGAVFGFLTLPYVYGTTRRALHGRLDQATQSAQLVERGHRLDRLALLAPLLLVISPQFAIWNASGLENSLFCLLLAGGTYRVVLEGQETHRRLISPWWFTLLAMTRRKASFMVPLDFWRYFWGESNENWQRPCAMVGIVVGPWGLYQWWRFTYFAWPFPNTYYGKLGKGTTFQPYEWSPSSWKVGWSYVKAYFQNHYILYFFPAMALGLSGWRIWKRPASDRVPSSLQWHAKEKRPIAQALGLLSALVMIDAAFQPWLVGGTAPSSVFGATVDAETSQLMVLGHSSGPGLMALLLACNCATLALALSRLRLAAFLAMMGVIWTGFSVGHYLMPDLVQDGNKGMTVGMGPLIFGLGSLLVLTVSGRAQWRSTVAAWLLTVVLFVLCWDEAHCGYVAAVLCPGMVVAGGIQGLGQGPGLEPGDGGCAVWIVDLDAFGMACSRYFVGVHAIWRFLRALFGW